MDLHLAYFGATVTFSFQYVSIFVSLEYLLASPLACPFASYKMLYLRNNAFLVQRLPFLVISLVLLIECVHIFSNVVQLL